MPQFPKGFLWGCATASYQIEGFPLADGAGPSIWHRFAHTPGNIRDNQNGDVACDHYRRYEEDAALMKELNLGAYRFSIAWPRILPEGTGRINPKGIDFYARLADSLLENGIRPFATLYHWDLPAALQDRGGWPNRDCAKWFADYASLVFDALGDRITDWITLNEPVVSAQAGYVVGIHAPGMKDLYAGMRAARHLILGHGLAVQAFRASGLRGQIGITLNLTPFYPASEKEEDHEAAERSNSYTNRMYIDPVMKGGYPPILEEILGEAWPQVMDGDLEIMSSPTDFLGVNYYTPGIVANAPGKGVLGTQSVPMEGKRTTMDWVVFPQGLYDLLTQIHRDYAPRTIYVTENGSSFPDSPGPDGEIEDPDRLEYLRDHFTAAHRALEDGVPLRGYFVWSLMDNFEWAMGYSQWFGVVRVDYDTQKRTIKKSGRWYSEVAAANGF